MKNGKTGFTHTPICTVTGQAKAAKEQLCHRISTTFTVCKLVRGFTLPELLVVIFIIAFSLSICAALGPSMNRARESANIALCANNMRQIGTAIAMYADSYGGLLPWYGGEDPSFKAPFSCKPDTWPTGDCPDCPRDNEIHPFVAYRDAPWQWHKPDGSLRPLRLACLYEAGIVEDARLFYCPSETAIQYRYEDYIVPLNPEDSNEWGVLPQLVNTLTHTPGVQGNQYVRTGYTYYPANTIDETDCNDIDFKTHPGYLTEWVPCYTARTLSQMDPAIPYLTDRIWRRYPVSQEELEERGGKPKVLAHRMGRVYSLNALFKDNHVIYHKNQDVFRSHLWWLNEETDGMLFDYREFYYGIYRAIGKVGNPLYVAPYFQQ